MVSILNPRKPLPPLSTETNYEAADFEGFEYFGAALTGSKSHSSPSLEEWDHN